MKKPLCFIGFIDGGQDGIEVSTAREKGAGGEVDLCIQT